MNCNRNSVLLDSSCLLYVYKLALRHRLLSLDVIDEQDIDPANLVPHIRVRKDKNDAFTKYQSIQGQSYQIEESSLSAKADFLTIELDLRHDLHCTMIYSKKIGKRADLVKEFKEMVFLLNEKPKLIEQYASLPDFGVRAILYWLETKNQYPNNIIPPVNYTSKKKTETNSLVDDTIKVSLAGLVV